VVEIARPDNGERDAGIKRGDHAEAGIPAGWIVNPEEQTITALKLAGGTSMTHGVFGRGEMATSALLTGFPVSVETVCDAE